MWGKKREARVTRPRDTSELHAVLRRGTLEELDAVYEPSNVLWEYSGGTSLLSMAVGNRRGQGVAIAHRLLDDGADVTVHWPVHTLLGGNVHDFELEAPLLERLLDLGADVNAVYPNRGTALEEVASKFKYTDQDLEPFYDVLLARPDIDFLRAGDGGRPVIVNLRKWQEVRGALVERVEALMTERGITLPASER